MPSISGPKISMPDVDFNLKGPKLKGDVDVSVPKVKGDIKAPKVEIEGPEIEGLRVVLRCQSSNAIIRNEGSKTGGSRC